MEAERGVLGQLNLMRREPGLVPFFASVGIVTLAGKLLHTPVGSARLVPVRVSSSAVPRCIPSGRIGASVGASGGGGAGGCPGARLFVSKKATSSTRKVRDFMGGIIQVGTGGGRDFNRRS